MEHDEGVEVKEMTSKQHALLMELLKSEELRQDEVKIFTGVLDSEVSTSADASALISYMLGLVRFRRQFGEEHL